MRRLGSRIRGLYGQEGFRGSVVTLLSGTAVTLVLSYLAVPILTRLFTPEQFGISDYFVTIVSVLATIASLRYEDAMMLPEGDDGARSVFRLALLLSIASAALVAACLPWGTGVAALLRVSDAAPWLWLVPPVLLLMRFCKLSEIWLSREKAFRTITVGEVTNKTAMLSARLGAGTATTLGAGGLIGGFLVGQAASAVYYGSVLLRSAGSPLRRADGALRSTAHRYRRFPAYAMPSSLLNAVVARLPVLLLPLFFSLEVIGLFGRAFVALAVPLGLAGTAIAQVFFVHAAEARRDGRLDALTETVHARLVMIGAFPTLLLIAAGPDLFEFVFGRAWRVAGSYERLLAAWFFLGAVASPLTRLFDVLERQRTELLLSIATCVVLTTALVAGGRSGNVIGTMGLIALAGGCVRLLQIGTMLHLAGVPLGRALRPYLTYGSLSALLVVPVGLLAGTASTGATVAASAGAGLLYVALLAYRELRGENAT